MQTDAGGDELELPPTIQALLAARVDRLPPAERAVLERASIEGRMFHRGALATMLTEDARPGLGTHLIALVRKEFIRPDKALFSGDDGFRFGHALIRDAAYAAVSKQLRADLHERFASWLDGQAGERAAEYDEIVAYHLEQAVRYHADLGVSDAHVGELRREATERLARAGDRAFARGDAGSAVNLLRRAAALSAGENRSDLLLNLGAALGETGDFAEAESVLSTAVAVAEAEGDTSVLWRARLARMDLQFAMSPVEELDAFAAQIREAIPFFDGVGDDAGLAHAWTVLSQIETLAGRGAAAFDAAQRAVNHARAAGDDPKLADAISFANGAMYLGPTTVDEALDRTQKLLETFGKNRTLEGTGLSTLCLFLGMAARFDEARDAARKAKANAKDLGQRMRLSVRRSNSAMVELWAGNFEGAERELRRAWDGVGEMGLDPAPTAVELANVLHSLRRDEEALELLDAHPVSRWETLSVTLWQSTRAKVLASLGRTGEAIELAAAARKRIARTDFLSVHGDVLLDACEVLTFASRGDEAIPLLEEALCLFAQKGNVVGGTRARKELDELLSAAR
jgi:tetratricopeptide (TPR) repeat protein